VETVSLNPARVINTHHRKGTLEPGKDADIVLIDKEFNVYSTIINGKLIN
jgi:N-acetylglucosamine-6-phosphate deacetylase